VKVVSLVELIRGFDGKGMLVDGRPFVTKDLLLQYSGTFESEKGSELILARKVGQKIYDCKLTFVELEDAEWAIIKQAVSKPKHMALVMGPFLEFIEKVDNNEFNFMKNMPKENSLQSVDGGVKVTKGFGLAN